MIDSTHTLAHTYDQEKVSPVSSPSKCPWGQILPKLHVHSIKWGGRFNHQWNCHCD